MKLHLGCGNKRITGFLNIDVNWVEGITDNISDVRNLSFVSKKSVELIYVSHVLEHIGRNEYMDVLSHWYSLLKPGGILRIAVPDMEAVFSYYNKTKDLNPLKGFLWGGQSYPENFHFMGWDFQSLHDDLIDVGFSSVERYDWRKTEHSHIDDYSQCYFPHMDKENGTLMSLNVEALK